MSEKEKDVAKTPSSTHFIELLKYPTLVFSIVIAIVVLKMVLGLEFGIVTELSTSGLKFAEKSNATTLKAISELESSLNEANIRIDSLENLLVDGTANENSNEAVTSEVIGAAGQTVNGTQQPIKKSETRQERVNIEAFAASQFVSDSTANIAGLKSDLEQKSVKKVGYIWIGNFDGTWEKMTLVWVDSGKVVDSPPDSILTGTSYTVRGNMVIRDGLPPNTKEYYRARSNIGVIPRGHKVTVLEPPQKIDREFAQQYWVKVEFSQ